MPNGSHDEDEDVVAAASGGGAAGGCAPGGGPGGGLGGPGAFDFGAGMIDPTTPVRSWWMICRNTLCKNGGGRGSKIGAHNKCKLKSA